jgi:hypothetical protein
MKDSVSSLDAQTQRYWRAMDNLVEKLKADHHILAAVLEGSLSYDQVWERSDIDLAVIERDAKRRSRTFCLVEDGIYIHIWVMSRRDFKRNLEKGLHGSFSHSVMSRSTLLFSKDPSIETWFKDLGYVGSRDQEIQLMQVANGILGSLTKAEKWFHVKKDYDYSFQWLMSVVAGLAQIELLRRGLVPGRESVQEAMEVNPDLFREIYHDFINKKKTRANVKKVLDRINGYLDENVDLIFAPILEFLAEEGTPRTLSELDEHFGKSTQGSGLSQAYEWLAYKEIIEQVSVPLRLTEKSQVEMQEAAFYYDADEPR